MGGHLLFVDAVQIPPAWFGHLNSWDLMAGIWKPLSTWEETRLKEIIPCFFEQTGSWIYRPKRSHFLHSPDGLIFTPFTEFITITGSKISVQAPGCYQNQVHQNHCQTGDDCGWITRCRA